MPTLPSISEILQVFNLAEYARAILPWQYRPYYSLWLGWSVICVLLALIMFCAHMVTRDRKIEWYSPAVTLDGVRLATGQIQYFVIAIGVGGKNISGNTIHQVDGEVTLLRDGRKLPLFVVADGSWTSTDDVDAVPSGADLNLGAEFRSDILHWDGFEQKMSPDDFLHRFGAFMMRVHIDGKEREWSLSIDELRDILKNQEREIAMRLTPAPAPPAVKKRLRN